MNKKFEALPYLFTSPAHLALILVVLFPILFTLYLSFYNMTIYHFHDYHFVGWQQYQEVFSMAGGNSSALWALLRTVIWTACSLILEITLAIALGILLNEPGLRGRGIYRSLLILPWAVPSYVSALVWKGMFNIKYGIINKTLVAIGLPAVPWLNDPYWGFLACVITNVWIATPFMMLVVSGGLQSIDVQLYEAAELDGATGIHGFFYITLPMLFPVMMPAIILTAFVTFKTFDIVFLLTDNIGSQVDLVMTYVYRTFRNFSYSLSAAFSVVIFLILAGLTLVNMKHFARTHDLH